MSTFQSGVMLSLAQSRLTLVIRLSFLGLNGAGIWLGRIYNSNTPDLYVNNAHHTMGWAVTWITLAQCIITAIRPYADLRRGPHTNLEEQAALIPVSAEAIAQHQPKFINRMSEHCRYSHDSGHGTEPQSSRSLSTSSLHSEEDELLKPVETQRVNADVGYQEKPRIIPLSRVNRILFCMASVLSSRLLIVLIFFHDAVDRLIFLLGFIVIVSGIVVYAGVFVGPPEIRNQD